MVLGRCCEASADSAKQSAVAGGCVVLLTRGVFLIVCLQLKMLQGVLPPVDLLQQYGLTHYLVFREAIQNGDVGLFQRSMQVRTPGSATSLPVCQSPHAA